MNQVPTSEPAITDLHAVARPKKCRPAPRVSSYNRDMAYGIIYRAQHRVTGKSYVGQTTVGLALRIRQHSWSKGQRGTPSYFDREIAKDGLDAFEFTQIDTAETLCELNEKERGWIATLGCQCPTGYNVRPGGEGHVPTSGFKMPEETVAKMSAYARQRTAEHRQRLSESLSGRPVPQDIRAKISAKLKGRKVPEETLAKRRGVPRSAETKAKIGAFQKTRPAPSAELRARMSAAQLALGKTISEEQKQQLRDRWTGHKQSAETLAKRAASLRDFWKANPDIQERRSAKLRGRKRSIEVRAKVSAGVAAWWAKQKAQQA